MEDFFLGPERDGWSVFVLPLEGPVDVEREDDNDGLLAGMFMLRTLSRMIWRMVFRNALRNSDVLSG